MPDTKPKDDEIRSEVALPDPAWAYSFHSGSHPQRAIPPDVTEAEAKMLLRERQTLHADVPPGGEPVDEDGNLARQPFRQMVNPDRPNQGVVYSGPTAAEDLALRSGRTIEEAEAIVDAPRARVEKARAERRKAGEGPTATATVDPAPSARVSDGPRARAERSEG